MNNAPPPTAAEGDAHLHRRETDKKARIHNRWYDSTKMQITIFSTMIGLLIGAAAVGYAVRDDMRTVRGTEARWERQKHTDDEQWAAINTLTTRLAMEEEQGDLILSVVSEIHCTLTADTEAQRARCSSSETRRRLEQIRNRGTAP